jgi:5-methyltetrahydropteroyltriglutamate--homocysteine methyltransferase
MTRADFNQVADVAGRDVVRLQEDVGCDVITDGELRRDNFYSFVAERFSGVRLMTLAEMLEVVEDKAGFERLLEALDVPAYAISNPVCTGRLEAREPLVLDDMRFVRRHTERPLKATLPGPYLLTRAMFVAEVTKAVYPNKEDLAEDVVRLRQDWRSHLSRELEPRRTDFASRKLRRTRPILRSPARHIASTGACNRACRRSEALRRKGARAGSREPQNGCR